jgi:hypothetical protein
MKFGWSVTREVNLEGQIFRGFPRFHAPFADGVNKANFVLPGPCALQDAIIEFSAPGVFRRPFRLADFGDSNMYRTDFRGVLSQSRKTNPAKLLDPAVTKLLRTAVSDDNTVGSPDLLRLLTRAVPPVRAPDGTATLQRSKSVSVPTPQ